MGLREVVGVVARRQLVSERGEGDDQVDGAPDGGTHGALGRPGICGGGEHVVAKLIRAPDGRGANTRSRLVPPPDLALQRGKCATRAAPDLADAAREVRSPTWSTSASSHRT